MRKLVVGACAPERTFVLEDPDAPYETEFEEAVKAALRCLYPDYVCFRFTGSFLHEGRVSKPDLALVSRDFSHWFVIEVELTSHSFDGHVMPQVRAFQYGEPQADCVSIIERETGISRELADLLVDSRPIVAVVANKPNADWERILQSHTVQFCSLSVFRSPDGTLAMELDGSLFPPQRLIAWGVYSATDRSIRVSEKVPVSDGPLQIYDPLGSVGAWSVRRDQVSAWITKDQGEPSIAHNATVQIWRTDKGQVSLRVASEPDRRPTTRRR